MKTFEEEAKVIEESIKLNGEYTTFKEIRHKNLISNNDVIKLLEEVGFNEIKNEEDVGYLIKCIVQYVVRQFYRIIQPTSPLRISIAMNAAPILS